VLLWAKCLPKASGRRWALPDRTDHAYSDAPPKDAWPAIGAEEPKKGDGAGRMITIAALL